MPKDREIVRVPTLFLSDLHLGTKGCQAELLLHFLKHHDADQIYLVGDIVDGWRLKSGWYWPQAHNDVAQKLLRKVHRGARLIYIAGNHDEFARDYVGQNFGGIEIMEHAIHEGRDGRRYLVVHGDGFDLVVRHAPWLAHIGNGLYGAALGVDHCINKVRRRLGWTYGSLSDWTKREAKRVDDHIGRFENHLSLEARRHDVDGVICGHIHHPAIRDDAGIRYMNIGDWVESCSALIEGADGSFDLVRWADEIRRPAVLPADQSEIKQRPTMSAA